MDRSPCTASIVMYDILDMNAVEPKISSTVHIVQGASGPVYTKLLHELWSMALR